MSELYPPLTETNFRYEHQGVHFFLRIKQLADGRWDTWICFQGSEDIVIDHEAGTFAGWDEAHEAGLSKAHDLIGRTQARKQQ